MSNITQLKPKYDFTLEDKVEQLRALDRELKRIEKAYSLLKTDIIHDIGDSDRIVNQFGHEIATYTSQTRENFDAKSLKTNHPDLALQYVTQTEYKTFRLK